MDNKNNDKNKSSDGIKFPDLKDPDKKTFIDTITKNQEFINNLDNIYKYIPDSNKNDLFNDNRFKNIKFTQDLIKNYDVFKIFDEESIFKYAYLHNSKNPSERSSSITMNIKNKEQKLEGIFSIIPIFIEIIKQINNINDKIIMLNTLYKYFFFSSSLFVHENKNGNTNDNNNEFFYGMAFISNLIFKLGKQKKEILTEQIKTFYIKNFPQLYDIYKERMDNFINDGFIKVFLEKKIEIFMNNLKKSNNLYTFFSEKITNNDAKNIYLKSLIIFSTIKYLFETINISFNAYTYKTNNDKPLEYTPNSSDITYESSGEKYKFYLPEIKIKNNNFVGINLEKSIFYNFNIIATN